MVQTSKELMKIAFSFPPCKELERSIKSVEKLNFLKCARSDLAQILCQSIYILYLTPCKNSALQEPKK